MLKAIYFFILVSLFSCSAVQKHGLNHFTIPESQGEKGERFEFQFQQVKKVYPAKDLRDPVIDDQKKHTDAYAFSLKGAHGLTSWLDLDIATGVGQEFYSGLKAQVFGQSMRSAGQGNFSAAIAVGYGILVTADEISNEDLYDQSQAKRMYIINSGTLHYDVVIGYRVMAPLLIYFGHHWSKNKYTLKMKEGLRDTLKYSIRNDGAYLGGLFNFGAWSVQGNFSYSDFNLSSLDEEEGIFSVGLALGVLF